MSTEPEQETFADGLTEDLITDLSRTAGLFVIARNSTFAYKGRPVDARTIARDLGVRYLLEGSVRRAAARVRINAQLIDAVGGSHLWTERFDSSLDDVFAVQDEVVGKIVDALVGRLVPPPPRQRPTRGTISADVAGSAKCAHIRSDGRSPTRSSRSPSSWMRITPMPGRSCRTCRCCAAGRSMPSSRSRKRCG